LSQYSLNVWNFTIQEVFSMKKFHFSFVTKSVGPLLVSALGLFPLGAARPAHAVFWDARQAEIGPQVPPPQGILEVYSERYVTEDEGAPVFHRRPIQLYDTQGHLLGTYTNGGINQVGPVHLDLPPGHYVVATRCNGAWRGVQVDVEDGRETVVPSARFTQAALFSPPADGQ
jgi:hypothetical protein